MVCENFSFFYSDRLLKPLDSDLESAATKLQSACESDIGTNFTCEIRLFHREFNEELKS